MTVLRHLPELDPGAVTSSAGTQAGRYLRTVAYLQPGQILARARLRTQRAFASRIPRTAERILGLAAPAGDSWPCSANWPRSFVPFDGRHAGTGPDPTEILDGSLTLLGHTRRLYRPGENPRAADWVQADAPLLWRYHLHYWDWAWSLTAHPDRDQARSVFARLYTSWRTATAAPRGTAWAPYVASLRAWTLCALFEPLARNSAVMPTMRADLGRHEAFLRLHLETDVGGNHLIKNLKALIGLAVTIGDTAETGRYHPWVDMLRAEVRHQVLTDGGHFERAPAYHCQVLADLDDVVGLLAATAAAVPDELTDAVIRMRQWLRVVVGPDGSVPLLNDGYPVPAGAVADLLSGGVAPTRRTSGRSPTGLRLLAETGLAALRAGRWHLLADVGPACPDTLPAHAHADTLAFLLWWDGAPLIVDTATSTYEPGPVRAAERSTAAHATVVIDGIDSTEVWGAFRAGRRARPTIIQMAVDGGEAALTASHDGYRNLPGHPTHQRRFRVSADRVRIDDRVTGAGRHQVEVHFPLAPDTGATVEDPARTVRIRTAAGQEIILHTRVTDAGATAAPRSSGRWDLRPARRAVGWQHTVPALTVVYVIDTQLPIEIRTDLAAVRQTTGKTGRNARGLHMEKARQT
ncbi:MULTISPECIES: heparinase II/III family protein [unclassified Frankia]|uniref:heparinase II/III family protein n=1 Tax=unclassified Frankia TaxID=2632575 RepID=UPI001EF4CD01|nr:MULTISPECIES: heparinase II/III family protein [unclassified Frankia]